MLYIDYGQGQVAILIYFFLIMVRIKPMATRDIIEQLGPSFRFQSFTDVFQWNFKTNMFLCSPK